MNSSDDLLARFREELRKAVEAKTQERMIVHVVSCARAMEDLDHSLSSGGELPTAWKRPTV